MKKIYLFIFVLIVVIVTVLLGFVIFKEFLLYSYNKIDLDFVVGDHLGFDPDPDALHFGTIPKGFYGFRDIQIQNLGCEKCIVYLRSNIKWLKIDNNNFILKEGETKSVRIFLNVPNDAELGKYYGYVYLYIWKTI